MKPNRRLPTERKRKCGKRASADVDLGIAAAESVFDSLPRRLTPERADVRVGVCAAVLLSVVYDDIAKDCGNEAAHEWVADVLLQVNATLKRKRRRVTFMVFRRDR